ncbi:MAG: DUF2997 domain-containing protein [Isosphaeraceae bacterium]
MNDEEIEIEIGADGQVVVRTIGIKGPRCQDIAEAIALIVGRVESSQLTDEYYEAGIQAQTHVEQRLRRFGE